MPITHLYAVCAFCGAKTPLLTAVNIALLKDGERYLAGHGACLPGSGLLARDNEKMPEVIDALAREKRASK